MAYNITPRTPAQLLTDKPAGIVRDGKLIALAESEDVACDLILPHGRVALTLPELEAACRNIGFDITCGACAAVFFTGIGASEHDAHCSTRR